MLGTGHMAILRLQYMKTGNLLSYHPPWRVKQRFVEFRGHSDIKMILEKLNNVMQRKEVLRWVLPHEKKDFER